MRKLISDGLQFSAGVVLFFAISAIAACSTPLDTDWGGMSYAKKSCDSSDPQADCQSEVTDTISAVGKSNR